MPSFLLACPDILSRNIPIEEYHKHQLQHKRILRDFEFFDKKGTLVSYQIQHEGNPNDTCNDFYPIKYTRSIEEKGLRLQNDGGDFALSSVLDEFLITSIQQASDCFRMVRFVNQFRRICGPETQFGVSANASNADYSSINYLRSAEDYEANQDNHYDISQHIDTDCEDDKIVCDISVQADKRRLCEVKQVYELVIGKTDAALAEKLLTLSNALHLDTKALTRKLDEVAKTVVLDVSTILAEQVKDAVLGTVRSWIRENTPPDSKSPEIQLSKSLLRYCQEFNRLLNEEEGQPLCYKEPSEKLEEENLRICFPLSPFLTSSNWGTITKWLDIWEVLKHMPMPKDSTTGAKCLIGFVP